MNKPISVCVVTNMFFDEDYIIEWCEHYYNIGFERIYILEDLNGRDRKFIDLQYMKNKVNEDKMIIEQIPHQNQWRTYPEFYEKHKYEFSWCGIFDSDEFLVLNKHKNIKEFLNDPLYENADVITVNWRMFADNDHLYKTEGTVVERFPEPAEYKDPAETKILIKGGLKETVFFIGHCCIANGNPYRTVFCSGDHYTRMNPYHKNDYSVAAINHYYTKSTEEFINRKTHGRLDIPEQTDREAFPAFITAYFNIAEDTPEKRKMFNEAMSKLK